MKRAISMGLIGLLLIPALVFAGELKVGEKASDWLFKNADKKEFSMVTWKGKVLMVNYVDPDTSDLNEHFTDAIKKAKDTGLLKDDRFKGIGIADCKATWKPNFLIRTIAGRKAKKYKTTILFDTKAFLRDAWGLKKDTSNIIILDKNRVCRAIVRGRVPEDQVEKLVQLVAKLQKK